MLHIRELEPESSYNAKGSILNSSFVNQNNQLLTPEYEYYDEEEEHNVTPY